MKEVLKLTADLRTKADTYTHEIRALLGGAPQDLPSGVFGMIFNNLTLSLELISYYDNVWKAASTTNATSVEEARKQNGERILLIQKMTFISILSSLEFCFKNYVHTFPAKIGDCRNARGKVYLLDIINRSKSTGIVSPDNLELWEGLIHLRNYLVHNNGVAQETKTYRYPNSQLVLVDGQMTQGNLKLFPHLIDWLLDASKNWVGEMHKK